MKTSQASVIRIGLFAILAVSAIACGSDTDEADANQNGVSAAEETDASLCKSFCENLPSTCAAAVEDMSRGGGCEQQCVSATDSSTKLRRCMRDAKSCDELKACKQAP